MSRWAVLPAELDPRVRQLVVRLRRLKDHSGLSLRQLAARTGYSPKSWERYLGGRSLPPREAVEALARVVGEDPTRLLALHEVATEVWGNRRADTVTAKAPAPHAATAEPEILSAEATEATEATEAAEATARRSPGRSLRVALVSGAVALVLAVSTAVFLVVRLARGEQERPTAPLAATAASAAASASQSASQSAPAYTCRVERIDGRWYAGNSRTQDAILANGHAGPEVAEAQCLLRRAGISPGGIDGIFGPVTERAVKQVQKRAGLVVDGIVGPHTWKALRG
ncbi:MULTISPECIES: peptidoglycan-binding protein [unclassified Streptomyces]|uniref:peptidoglycan-binding protein n=1 Tax=unclassified Streptomyces TaxID=2593676 RepID=UPI0023653415|nr:MULTISPECIES: peptidoglycan-binding protein [unclassified Streptomyces]MDF3147339.1 peptidoglycan-binding protein [Streptomyces sp. T21Q-yed]WDF40328.1 peptidoglycan-binding protein [Streptomyces sp. T12]